MVPTAGWNGMISNGSAETDAWGLDGSVTEGAMGLRYVLGIGLVIGALVVISVVTYSREAVAYYTVDELYDAHGLDPEGETLAGVENGRALQVRGEVDYATVDRGDDGLSLSFRLLGREGSVQVIYQGLVPDTFDRAESVTVGGRLMPSGVFEADELFVQCPSKYEAEPPAADDIHGSTAGDG